jgi:BTB/POZ domain-containing protein 9
MSAADYYGLDELRKVCMEFVKQCINLDTVCTLLASAERFIHYKSTRFLLQRVGFHSIFNYEVKHKYIQELEVEMYQDFFLQALDFVDEHGSEVLNLGAFTIIPQHVVRLILSRKGLKADELTKFQVSF